MKMGKQPNMVRGNRISCANYKQCPMCYGCRNNRQFCWDVVGDLIIRRLEELEKNGELYI